MKLTLILTLTFKNHNSKSNPFTHDALILALPLTHSKPIALGWCWPKDFFKSRPQSNERYYELFTHKIRFN